jgi:PAS domain S-box-containing protein
LLPFGNQSDCRTTHRLARENPGEPPESFAPPRCPWHNECFFVSCDDTVVTSQNANPLSEPVDVENPERLLLAETAAGIGTWEWDPAHGSRSLSPELHRIFGTQAEDPDHAQRWADRVHPDDWSKVQQCMAEAAATGEMDFEYRYLHPHDGLRWFYCKGQRFGREARMFGIVQDITERKKTEEALADTQDRYRTVAETAPDAILSIDEDSTILFANPATAEVFGYRPEELVGKNLTMLMPDSMRHLHKAGVQRYAATGTRQLNWHGTELPGLHKDGREISLEVSFGEYTKAGRRYFTGFARDIEQRKSAERALRESEQRLRVVTEATPVMIWMSGTDKLCYYFNRSWLDFVGRPLEEEMGNGWAENVHPEDFDRCLQIYVTCFDARQPFEMEYRLRHRSGEYRWILDHGVPRFTATGVFEGYVGGCLDIHEQKEAAEKVRIAAEALRKSEERLRALVNASANLLFRASPDWTQMWHLDGHGFISDAPEPITNWMEISIYPEDRPLVLAAVRRAIETKSDFQLEHRVRRMDGTVGWTLSRAVPLLDSGGNIVEWFGAASDITDRKNAEEARRRLAAIVESSDDAIVSKDLHGIVTSWNEQAERLFGYKEEEMIGRSILTVIPPEMHGDEELILGKIRAGQKIEHFETVRVAKSGERVDVSLSISPVRDEHGNIIGAAKIARDIREKKKIERALRTTEKLAAAGRLAATVAHEINNPLEAITNLLYLARTTTDREAICSLLAQADEELKRVALVSKQTLGFYRERNGVKPLRLGGIIESLVFVFQTKARGKSIQIRSEARQDPEINAIESELRQVIANLLNNSLDASSGGGTIRIRVSSGRSWDGTSRRGARITVADSGRGINREDRAKLFEPFFTANKDVGTGLGLWVTRGIVSRHGGTIRFRSSTRPGQSGTVFTVFLPADAIPGPAES